MKQYLLLASYLFIAGLFVCSCASNPYSETNRSHRKQVKAYTRTLKTTPVADLGATWKPGDYWVGATNFNLRKPNYVVIHHTEQNSTEQTLKTFTTPKTQVSAHYVIGRNGQVYHMLNDYLRAWHGGVAKWGNNTDINSSSIGIELDNNGIDSFPQTQINSLLQVLAYLKKTHNIPTANFIGHADIAPARKVDPNRTFPWKKLAQNGYGLWYDEIKPDTAVSLNTAIVLDIFGATDSTAVPNTAALLDSIPASFNPQEALRIIGYDTSNLEAAIKAFKLHFVQKDISGILTDEDKRILYNLYKKYF